jgi:hypothetical protein
MSMYTVRLTSTEKVCVDSAFADFADDACVLSLTKLEALELARDLVAVLLISATEWSKQNIK